MRLSRYFIPTMRETPSDAVAVSHRLMLRSGMIRQTAAGIYAWLPLGLRVLQKIEAIVREEMMRAGAIECLLPTVQSADLWQQSGRYDAYGPEMLRFKDRHGREMLFGPTAEELFTAVFRDCVASYKHLPRTLFQIQWKFRDEIRPRNGVMRGREFLMKDAYSFDLDEESARKSYNDMAVAYFSAFKRMGLDAEMVLADSGPIGGRSHEFLVGGLEVGHIFSFGTKYSEAMGLEIQTPAGRINPLMGSYGIGVSRLLAAIIETNHDDAGIIWPAAVAPFERLIVNASPNDPVSLALADEVYDRYAGTDVLYDDRDERGKFIEADLLGIPEQIIIGARNAAEGNCEIKDRRSGERRVVKVHDL